MRTLLTVLLGCASLLGAKASSPPQSGAESQLSPQAAYDQAVQPLEITRRSPKNWSEVELNALKIARENAKAACSARQPEQFSGEDLLALAHLCAFAQDWQAVLNAAANYVAAALDPVEHKGEDTTALATAFDYQIQASLNLDHGEDAAGYRADHASQRAVRRVCVRGNEQYGGLSALYPHRAGARLACSTTTAHPLADQASRSRCGWCCQFHGPADERPFVPAAPRPVRRCNRSARIAAVCQSARPRGGVIRRTGIRFAHCPQG